MPTSLPGAPRENPRSGTPLRPAPTDCDAQPVPSDPSKRRRPADPALALRSGGCEGRLVPALVVGLRALRAVAHRLQHAAAVPVGAAARTRPGTCSLRPAVLRRPPRRFVRRTAPQPDGAVR